MLVFRGFLLVLLAVCILLAGVGCKAVVKGGAGAGVRALSGGDIDCSDDNSPSVEWSEQPAIVDGNLALRGRLLDAARLHNASREIPAKTPVPGGGGFYLPAFSLIRLKSGDVSPVATIWPNEMKVLGMESAGGGGQVLYAKPRRYEVASRPDVEFDILVYIPPSLQEGEGKLLVLVWPPVRDIDNPPDPIGVECL